jgi:hypothetical protein
MFSGLFQKILHKFLPTYFGRFFENVLGQLGIGSNQ